MTSAQHRSHKNLVLWQKPMRLPTRQTTRESLQFLHIAPGSSVELETQLLIAGDLGDLAANDLSAALTYSDAVGRLLNAVINALHRRLIRTSPLTASR